jgi:hypothetical protein
MKKENASIRLQEQWANGERLPSSSMSGMRDAPPNPRHTLRYTCHPKILVECLKVLMMVCTRKLLFWAA